MLLGLINSEPLNAYEIIKKLQFMNVKSWYEIADSTVYATIKTLEKKAYIVGKVQKTGICRIRRYIPLQKQDFQS